MPPKASVTAPDGPPHDPRRLIEVLDRRGVEYLMCGGAAATFYGARRVTMDADAVVLRTRDNLERLAGALKDLNARLRVDRMSDEEAKLLPVRIDAYTLEKAGMSTWMTDAGGFDVLAGLEAADGRLVPFEELAERAVVLRGGGFVIRAAALEDIITAKERADREKDREALPELRALRDGGAVGRAGTGPQEGPSDGPGPRRRLDGGSGAAEVVDAAYPQGFVRPEPQAGGCSGPIQAPGVLRPGPELGA